VITEARLVLKPGFWLETPGKGFDMPAKPHSTAVSHDGRML